MSGGEFDVEVPPPEGEAGDVGAMGRRTDCTVKALERLCDQLMWQKLKGDAKPGVFWTPWSSSPQRVKGSNLLLSTRCNKVYFMKSR